MSDSWGSRAVDWYRGVFYTRLRLALGRKWYVEYSDLRIPDLGNGVLGNDTIITLALGPIRVLITPFQWR